MSPTRADWKADDSVVEGPKGVARVRAAVKKHRLTVKDRVITSRDPGMHDLHYTLMREGMPPGIRTWQIPFVMEGPAFFFLTVSEPGAIVPSHEHKRDLFRIIVSGSIITNGIELKSGDWMFVPKGVSYGYSAALNPGAISYHCYG